MESNIFSSSNSVEKCCHYITQVINDSIMKLYYAIDDFIFQDIDYGKVVSRMPMWVSDAGIFPESTFSKDVYEKLKNKSSHPIFEKFIYHTDLCGKLAAIQDRFEATIMYIRKLYDLVPCTTEYSESEYTIRSRSFGQRETKAHMLLNSIFVAYASIFDLLTKVAIEQFEYNNYDFSKYKKMKCSGVIFNKSIRNIDPSLKTDNMLFSEPIVIRKIESFRNEFVHNGPWDLRCSIYCMSPNSDPGDVLIYSPDMDENGNFVSSGSRNKFYSQANRINVQLPDLLNEATSILKNTINQLAKLYKDGTTRKENEEYTKECLEAINAWHDSLIQQNNN